MKQKIISKPERLASKFGPAPIQIGLKDMYEKISWARQTNPKGYEIKNITAFKVQKHGMSPKEAISFGIELENGMIIQQAGVMGGISAGVAEPGTHASIQDAIDFFNANVKEKMIGLNVTDPKSITNKIIEIDEQHKATATNQDKPSFSYIGSEISIGLSMITTAAFAERLGVPTEVVINYLYNEHTMTNGLSNEIRPMSIPVNLSVVYEGGAHGATQTLQELIDAKIIKDASLFPKRFLNPITKKDRLPMVPPQETQVMVYTETWKEAHDLGIKLTTVYQNILKENGIDYIFGAESGCTTKQVRTHNGDLINQELVLDLLNKAVDALGEDANKIMYALDIASSEIYISELDMYYIGPSSAGNDSGLVTNAEFTTYKLNLFNQFPRFISVEDWAVEDKIEHWQDAKAIMPNMIQMGDDNTVSNAFYINKFKDVINAHLQKPNQSGEQEAMFEAVGTSHQNGNISIFSHRGTRPELETYTALAAIGMGGFGGKWTLYGPGRGGLIAAMNQVEAQYADMPNVKIPYQGGVVLQNDGPYNEVGWAQVVRAHVNP